MAATLPATAPTSPTLNLLARSLPRRRPLSVAALDGGGGRGVGGDRRACPGLGGGMTAGSQSPQRVARRTDVAAGIITPRRRNFGRRLVEGKEATPERGVRGGSRPWKSVASRSPSARCGPQFPPSVRTDRLFSPAGISLTSHRFRADSPSSSARPSSSLSSSLLSGSSPMAGMGVTPIRILPPRLWGTSTVGRGIPMGIIAVIGRGGCSPSADHGCVGVKASLRRLSSSTDGPGGDPRRGETEAEPATPSDDDKRQESRHGVNESLEDKREEGQTTALTIVDRLPPSAQPYARLIRLDKPWGSMLLLWPCLWSTALAAPPGCPPDPKLCFLFATGAFVMRGAGCVINDLWDADFDRRVERTRSRPLASGELTQRQAVGFLATQLALGLGVLVSLPHAGYCVKLGMASVPLVVAYPLMKRFTNWPQLVLGMTFNWGALMGWAAVHGSLDWSVVGPLYGSGIAWTLVYDTLYAHQDKVDDAKLGLKSTALHFGDEHTKSVLYGFSCLSLAGWTAAGHNADLVSPDIFYAGCAAAFGHLVWQIRTADLDDPDNLARRFRSNQVLGGIVFASCVAGNVGVAVGA